MSNKRIPTLHWIVAILAILWNLFGVLSFIGHAFLSDTAFSGMTVEQQVYMTQFPTWGYVVFGAAVTTGILGAIGLLMRKRWAALPLTISLVFVLINQFYPIVATNYMEVFGAKSIYFPIFISLMSALQLLYARYMGKQHWSEG